MQSQSVVGHAVQFLSDAGASVPAWLMVLLEGLPVSRRCRVVDVGANPNVADPPYATMLKQGLCDVVGFEPHPAAFADLQKIKGPRETYLPFAVGDGSRQELKVYAAHGFTSVFEPSPAARKLLNFGPWYDIEQRIPFDTVALDNADNVERFDLLKIDIQGGEGAVFTGAAKKLQSACAVIVELRYFQLYDGEPMMAGLDRQLQDLGFRLHKILPPVYFTLKNSQSKRLIQHRNRDQIIDGDAIYIRDLDRLAEFDTEQLVHLAVMGAEMIGSHSLVVLCLDELVARGLVAPDLPRRYVDALPRKIARPRGKKRNAAGDKQ